MKFKLLYTFNGLAQLFLVIGIYGILFSSSIWWQVILAFGIILLGISYILTKIEKDEIYVDEMFKKISGASSDFASKIALVGIIALGILLIYSPNIVSANEVLAILFSILLLTKIAHQFYWYHTISKEIRQETIKNRIKECRTKCKLTQEKLAKKVGINKATIVFLEMGKYNPSLKLAHKIAKVLKTNFDKLFVFDD